MSRLRSTFLFFFFNDTATTEIYTLSLHDALPISDQAAQRHDHRLHGRLQFADLVGHRLDRPPRSEEHTSELQSPCNLVCRLLLEKKNSINSHNDVNTTRKLFAYTHPKSTTPYGIA